MCVTWSSEFGIQSAISYLLFHFRIYVLNPISFVVSWSITTKRHTCYFSGILRWIYFSFLDVLLMLIEKIEIMFPYSGTKQAQVWHLCNGYINFVKWLMALMSSYCTRSYKCKENSSQRHFLTISCDLIALTTIPWFKTTFENGFIFSCNFIYPV